MANLLDLIRQNPQLMQAEVPDEVLGGVATSVVNDTGVYEPGIQVDGTVPRPLPVDQSQYLLSSNAPDLRNTEWAQAAVDARNENDKKVEHKGMFGMKGTLRNVLGVLGDAFLVQGGANPVYAPTRQRERMGDAMAGYSQAPRSAVERMTAVDPEFAREMGETVSRQELAQAAAEAARAKEIAERRAKGATIVGGMLGAEGLADKDTYEKMKPIINGFIKQYGLEDLYQLPDVYDPGLARAIKTGSMTPYQQEQDANNDQRTASSAARNAALTAQGEDRLSETRRHNKAIENRPTSSGKPSQPTEAGELARIRRKVDNGTPLKPGEQATWNRYINGSSGGRGSSRSNRRPVTQTTRFR